ncbi:hapless 2-like [Ischnura elegans]|uniref:hapless 2-like n=1 Tax=Ischnura elegans TaxID=197161 RepID=UPI001ED872C0|nr:hapless 2-like [Ischnura elegans]
MSPPTALPLLRWETHSATREDGSPPPCQSEGPPRHIPLPHAPLPGNAALEREGGGKPGVAGDGGGGGRGGGGRGGAERRVVSRRAPSAVDALAVSSRPRGPSLSLSRHTPAPNHPQDPGTLVSLGRHSCRVRRGMARHSPASRKRPSSAGSSP